MFEKAEKGDKVWSYSRGAGKVMCPPDSAKQFRVKFMDTSDQSYLYNSLGFQIVDEEPFGRNPDLFWRPIKVRKQRKPVPTPDLPIDIPILVRGNLGYWKNRHLKGFDDKGRCIVWPNGLTSFTTGTLQRNEVYPYYKTPDGKHSNLKTQK